METWVVSTLGLPWIARLGTVTCESLYELMFSFLLGRYQGERLAHTDTHVCRTALHSGRATSRFRAPFHDVAGLPTSPYPDQRRLLVCQITLILVGGMCFLVADLISISLVTTDMEHRVFTDGSYSKRRSYSNPLLISQLDSFFFFYGVVRVLSIVCILVPNDKCILVRKRLRHACCMMTGTLFYPLLCPQHWDQCLVCISRSLTNTCGKEGREEGQFLRRQSTIKSTGKGEKREGL